MLTKRELIDYCLTFLDAYEDYPFNEDSASPEAWAALRHKGNRKAFAFVYERKGLLRINLKCDPMFADLLRSTYPGVVPAYHMNKEHWNTVTPEQGIPEQELYEWIRQSYDLTALKRAKRIS